MGKLRRLGGPVNGLIGWVRRQSVKVKVFLGVAAALVALVVLWLLVHDYMYFFAASEAIHAAGILVLVYKLAHQQSCSGLSLRSQELTALYLAVRLYCSVVIEKNIHTALDFATLIATIWVIYMIRFKLKATYIVDLDNMPRYALMVEPFTSHYVFALGVARFLGCAHWILRVIQLHGKFLDELGHGVSWLPMVLFSEAVQTFILADLLLLCEKCHAR